MAPETYFVLLAASKGVCRVGAVPADAEEAPVEGLQGRLSPLSPDPEHPRLPGREGVHDGPHRVHEPNAVHCTTGGRMQSNTGSLLSFDANF